MSTFSAPELRTTDDGSPTLYNSALQEHYHSTHGAEQESRHIFVEAGLKHRLEAKHSEELRVLEIGFGTGLNALLTAIEAKNKHTRIHYTTLELYPLTQDIYCHLHYQRENTTAYDLLMRLHECPWGQEVEIFERFTLLKEQVNWLDYIPVSNVDLIYFDAFSPDSQPELWEEERFSCLFDAAREGAVLVTYCAKGEIRRRLQRTGFVVERLPGPPGKREILRATKPLVESNVIDSDTLLQIHRGYSNIT